jgi:hypothetical protein
VSGTTHSAASDCAGRLSKTYVTRNGIHRHQLSGNEALNLLPFAGASRRRIATLAVVAAFTGAAIGLFSGVAGTTRAAAADASSDATFDSSLGTWQPKTGTSARRVTSPTQSGTGSLEVVNSTQSAREIGAVSATKFADCVTPTPGSRYVARAWVRSASSARAASVALTFLDGSGAVAARIVGQALKDSSRAWLRPLDTAAVAPANAKCVIVGVAFQAAAPGEKHYIDTVSLTTRRAGAARIVGPLHTSGTKILDANDRSVRFRGVNRSGMEGTEDGPPTDHDISQAHAWGANFVRLPLGQQYWLSNNCYYDPTYRSTLDDAVKLITGKGMVVMLDLHWHTIGNCGHYGQWPMSESAPSVTFWKQVAARYKDNPLVAFDLYNEPHHVSDDQWRNGGPITWHGVTYRTAGMQEMYDAVRSTGAKNLVMVTAPHWGNIWPKKTSPITGTNIVYAAHAYTCPQVPAPQCTNTAPYDPSQFFQFWTTAETKYPIMVTEFGWPNPNDGLYIHNVIAYAEAHNWNWSVYVWGKTWGPFTLLANNKDGQAFQPRLSGMPVLAAFPGT